MARPLIAICISVALAGCAAYIAATDEPPALTVFLTGNELGSMQPCGCAEAQLGGLDRRAAILNTVPPEKRFIIDTGNLVAEQNEQNLIKFNTIIEAFSLLEYDLVNLTEKDIQTAQELALLSQIQFPIITAYSPADIDVPQKFSKTLPLNGQSVCINVAVFNAGAARTDEPHRRVLDQIYQLFGPRPQKPTVNILLTNRARSDLIDAISQTGLVDVLVCPSDSDTPAVLDKSTENLLAVSVGSLGKYVGKLQITPGKSPNAVKLNYKAVPVVETLPQADALVELYKMYQQLVKEENLLEKYPRYVLPDGQQYMGSENCRICHEHKYNYEKWSQKAHAHAYQTLVNVGSQHDPECVICHVVGMEYESGFVSEYETPHLKNVGCEACHGPASEHIKNLGETKTPELELDCTRCHTQENSPNFNGNEQHYLEQIIHWVEPNPPKNVKK